MATAVASTTNCKVVGIADGDTLTCLTDANLQVTVRLAEIDAPEKKQPFGQRSRQALSDLCFGKPATLQVQSIDRYRRTVARVICAGTDANATQVRRGMAWVYNRYARDPALYDLQREARERRIGLWADADPVPPWEWRKQKRAK
ncbi:thermonuclease family protein [Chitiniphilus shinanonensis]|uniref:thermonuclease family protein n=1 Tax=Chitiniphilus shinanonensis TaxID=553088 RepID=UPI00306D7277